MAKTRVIKTEHAPGALGAYSQGIVANDFLFTAGQVALDPATGKVIEGDITAQTERVLQNLAGVLEAAGASWGDVVKTTVYLQNMSDFGAFNAVYGRILGSARPARSTVGVAGLPAGVLIEIDMIAAVGD
jgi:2-iminobutanoate/2-iminopropanoate deaminase